MYYTLEQFKNFTPARPTYAVFGDPIAHSVSPAFQRFLLGNYTDADYIAVHVPKERLPQAIELARQKLRGFNCTIPLKQAVMEHLDYIDPRAQMVNAVNTVTVDRSGLRGFNTDIDGFFMTLERRNIALEGKRVLLLGSGGVSAVFAHCVLQSGGILTIASRNLQTAKQLAGGRAECFSLEQARGEFDIIINGTPVGMHPNVEQCPVDFDRVTPNEFVFDSIYNPFKTRLLARADSLGVKTENGLFMLAAQGAASHLYWADRRFDRETLDEATTVCKAELVARTGESIILTGFMGSGKTTVGTQLARLLGYDFFDVDSHIEQAHGSITQIFSQHGEAHFRRLEREMLEAAIGAERRVISTGGGIVTVLENRKSLAGARNVAFLNLDLPTVIARLEGCTTRPKMAENMQALFDARLPLYRQCCGFEVDAAAPVFECVDRVLTQVLERG